jgi:hypothetical protein
LTKTDDYKQEWRVSATLQQTNAKKIFLCSKKSGDHLRVIRFFVPDLLRHKTESVPPFEPERKKAPQMRSRFGFSKKTFPAKARGRFS